MLSNPLPGAGTSVSRWRRSARNHRADPQLEHERRQVAKAAELEKSGQQAYREQSRKREQEREALIKRLDRLAGDGGNHLGREVLKALAERYGYPNPKEKGA